jgi:hypothetical protein
MARRQREENNGDDQRQPDPTKHKRGACPLVELPANGNIDHLLAKAGNKNAYE